MKKIAFLFSGQGAQYTGMMNDIAQEYKSARHVFNIADNATQRSISELCFAGSADELNLTHNTQPCVLAADLAAYQALVECGINPDAVAGFSLGEYAALVAANVLTMQDAFEIIQARADAMQEAVPVGQGAMAAVMKLTNDEVKELCNAVQGYVVPANYNCPGQVTVAGETKAVEELIILAKEKKIRTVKLPVSAPFHCEMMNPAAIVLNKVLLQYHFREPSIPVYMNVDGRIEGTVTGIMNKLVAQAKSSVCWTSILRNMEADGIHTFIEIGPGKTLTSFVNKTLVNVLALHVESVETLHEALMALQEDDI